MKHLKMKHSRMEYFMNYYELILGVIFIAVLALLFILFLGFPAQAMDCTKIGSKCAEEAEWRTVEGYKVHRNCWRYEDQFDCKYNGKNNCETLVEEGCYQVRSNCIKEVRGKCVGYKQEYNCPKEREIETEIDVSTQKGSPKDFLKDIECKTTIPCMDGSCADTSYKSNDELAEAMARISVLKDMKDNFKEVNEDGRYEFFKGGVQTCKIDVINFRNCCSMARDKGWGGKDLLNMWGCRPTENQLREERKANKCHYVGQYCAVREKITNICLEKKESYCCFQSDLVKTIQEQGRKQMGRGWGENDPEHPDCDGFIEDTQDKTGTGKHELSDLKFDEMDFGEVHHRWNKVDDKPGKKASEIQDLQREYKRIQENFNSKSSGFKGANPDIKTPDEEQGDRDESGAFVNKGGF